MTIDKWHMIQEIFFLIIGKARLLQEEETPTACKKGINKVSLTWSAPIPPRKRRPQVSLALPARSLAPQRAPCSGIRYIKLKTKKQRKLNILDN